ncbi:DNA recombination protein RmuC [Corticibacter populi]|uniref:DNA recombination protein RmuC n=1 Tax=Corticibacter populi TaxID=1550736 RepID=A0A3M6QKD9_9BURK|nr:DNA recombination protein RmuC [Corticibacter populi]RMX03487.1 DNA recombination protein RmuC [Corticibacter populi]RZS29927.1 DNA recombination protein RmuC [Corticibacter populi]
MPPLDGLPLWAALALAAAALLIGWLLGHWRAGANQREVQRQRLADWREQAEREIALWRDQLETLRNAHQHLQQQALQWREALDAARDERAQWQERSQRIPALEAQLQQSRAAEQSSQAELARLHSELAALRAQARAEQAAAADKLALLERARESLGTQFQQLAQTILEEKSQRFAEQNRQSLGQLLDPLRNRLQEFQGRIEQFYDAEGKQRAALGQQVHDLMGLNRRLSDEAHHLAQALKGSAKTQGNWGETVLERVLEQAGLRAGHDYEAQSSFAIEDGRRAQPDLIVHLPQQRHLIIDAKVSLTAYERYVRLDESSQAGERKAALRQHVESVRAHVRELAGKNYQKLYGLTSLDFVILFVPIEPAFMLALGEDERLSQEAWERNVLLVAPSTLLFVLRTIAHLWKQEAQTRNAQEIARRGGELYDKLVAFVAELENLGGQLDRAQQSWQQAMHRLASQKGNVIRQAEMLRELGIQPAKKLPQALLEQSEGGEDGEALPAGDGQAPALPPHAQTPADTTRCG